MWGIYRKGFITIGALSLFFGLIPKANSSEPISNYIYNKVIINRETRNVKIGNIIESFNNPGSYINEIDHYIKLCNAHDNHLMRPIQDWGRTDGNFAIINPDYSVDFSEFDDKWEKNVDHDSDELKSFVKKAFYATTGKEFTGLNIIVLNSRQQVDDIADKSKKGYVGACTRSRYDNGIVQDIIVHKGLLYKVAFDVLEEMFSISNSCALLLGNEAAQRDALNVCLSIVRKNSKFGHGVFRDKYRPRFHDIAYKVTRYFSSGRYKPGDCYNIMADPLKFVKIQDMYFRIIKKADKRN